MMYNIISYMISVRLQLPILPRHSEAGACELGIRYPTLQFAINIRWEMEKAEHAGKYHMIS